MDFIEFRNFGWNALTVSSMGTITLTCLQGITLTLQALRIWKSRSGLSVSPIWFLYSFVAHILILMYGIKQQSLAIFVAGLLTPLYIPILLWLWRFPGARKKDWIIGLGGMLFAGVIVLLFFRSSPYLIFAFLGCVAISAQPLTIIRTGKRGSLEIRLVLANIVANTFWSVYGFASNDWLLKIIMPAGLVLFIITLLLWFYAKTEVVQEHQHAEILLRILPKGVVPP